MFVFAIGYREASKVSCELLNRDYEVRSFVPYVVILCEDPMALATASISVTWSRTHP
jgi:hypothetical protein